MTGAVLSNGEGLPSSNVLNAALLLVDAWQPALDQMYRLGLANGREFGRHDEIEEEQRAWSSVARAIRAGANDPQHAELQRLREEPDHRPCPQRCGACSRCICAASWTERGGRHYLGLDAEMTAVRDAA